MSESVIPESVTDKSVTVISDIPDAPTLRAEVDAVLSPEHEQFCLAVASGVSYRQASIASGFHEQHGWRLMQLPHIRARIAVLVRDGENRDKAWLDNEWGRLGNHILGADLNDASRADATLRMNFLTAYARYKGWIKEKKRIEQVSVTMSKAELGQLLDGEMAALPIAQRKQIEATLKKLPAAGK